MPTPELSRRLLLGGVVTGLSLSGCDLVDSEPEAETTRTPGSGSGSAAAETPAEDPDTALVEQVHQDIDRMLQVVVAAVTARPRLRGELGAFRRLHREHLAALPAEGGSARKPRVAGGADAVRARVLTDEERLRARLADAAVASKSGALASLLASMSAAVAQQLAAPGKERS